MPAVSIDDAWGESNLLHPVPVAAAAPGVVARAASVQAPVADSTTDDAEDQSVLTPEAILIAFAKYDAIIEELRLIRKEEARRCTIQLAIAGVLFALLFVYVDRLQQQVRSLNSFMVHRQIPTLAGVAAPSM
jgi:hypothetical protein